ncbi:NTF2-like N-terminal transpeptidase domain-containing protein [Rhodococcus aetherivorans]|uniref:NTF2-like N-terminal transpeptidase domain-containing protein n=1 Tax=Rhodococcus aetherivorans TaxID=191292 RepID=UPI0002D21CA3|nr:NTF2-like N-terminal transpeptidase domain-containing protein [Rhodococcus aetherivorans]UGQ42121.1 penicillin-binding protein [Rhodococcus aetherivorans]CCW13415.1 penicillin-binding protein, putative [Rhodococcus aetherivorans]
MGFRDWRRGRGRVTALVSVVVLAAGMASCVFGEPRSDAQRLVDDFVAELNEGDAAGAAALTSYPNAAEASIRQMFEGMKDGSVDYDVAQFVELNEQTGFFTLGADWNFGPGKDWGYQVDGVAKNLAVGWRISWDPQVLVPDLNRTRTVHHVRTDAAPPKIFDRTGQLLMAEQTINAVVVDPALMPDPVDTTTRLAKVLEPVAPVITADLLQRNLAADPGARITAVKLRDQDYQFLEDEIVPIPGVVVVKTPTLISADRRISTPLLDPLRAAWQLERDATAGWAVTLEEPGADPVQVAGFQGPPPPDLQATLDAHVQLAAKEAVVSVGTPAAIVAIQPSTGGVLALDVNNWAMELGPVASRGLYPAGQTLDPVRLAAGLDRGVDPASVSTDDLADTARRLGLGLDYDVPGFDFETAQIGENRSGVVQFSGSDGGGEALLSPFGAALLAASVARGEAPLPAIVQGKPAKVGEAAEPLPPHVTDALRAAMAENVRSGPASFLKGHPGLSGIAAASGDDRWFYGYTGDLAFAVFVANADGGDRAVKMADMFLRELGKPPADR